MKWLALLVFVVALGGCTEDKGAVLARCELDGSKQFGLPARDSRTPERLQHMQTCMRAAGYERLREGACEFGTYSAACYRSATWVGRIFEWK